MTLVRRAGAGQVGEVCGPVPFAAVPAGRRLASPVEIGVAVQVVLAGGTGQLGGVLDRALRADGHDVVVLTRSPAGPRQVRWDGETLGAWSAVVDGADVVVNLAGRSVSCRYTPQNLAAMMHSRVRSAQLVGEAVALARRPPALWLQMSTATVYAHRFGAANDEHTGQLGGAEPGVPAYWAYSVEIARRWEAAQADADTPDTRRVALRTAMVMSPDRGGIFDVLSWLARTGLGGPVAGGRQYVSWIHHRDFTRAVRLLIDRHDITGPVNLAAPGPLPQRDLMRALRTAWRMPVGLPATRWLAEVGAFVLRWDTELLLKSRRVVPARLLAAGFRFDFPDWPGAAADLVAQRRSAG